MARKSAVDYTAFTPPPTVRRLLEAPYGHRIRRLPTGPVEVVLWTQAQRVEFVGESFDHAITTALDMMDALAGGARVVAE